METQLRSTGDLKSLLEREVGKFGKVNDYIEEEKYIIVEFLRDHYITYEDLDDFLSNHYEVRLNWIECKENRLRLVFSLNK